jgi:hypothetical protein
MPKITIADRPRRGICRLCSQPCTNEGHGFYHDGRDLGAVHGVRPHFAEPMARAVA